jgi:hypothetical protein
MLTAGIGAAGSLFGGLFGGSASGKASQQYIQALKQSEDFLKGQEQQGLQNYSPYLEAGKGAATSLSSLLGAPGQGLLTPWTQKFTAPTAAEAEQTPGYQFQLQQGLGALQNSAAGRGGLLSGRTLADLNNYAQGTASSNYQNVFNNALTQYQSAYQSFLNNQNNQYSRLMGVSGQGLQAAGGAGGLISGIGGDIASLMGQQGAAAAQGTIGRANAYGSILPGISNSIEQGYFLNQLKGNASPSSTAQFDPSIWKGTPQYMPQPSENPYAGLDGAPPPYMLSNLAAPQMPQF